MHKRLAFIDTLRGIAVMSVVLQHALEQIVTSGGAGDQAWAFHDAIGHYFNFGRFGVVLFFFVSGFVIPNSFPDSPAPIRDFTISRIFRLYPAYWVSIAIVLVLSPALEAKSFPPSQVLANLTMFQMFLNIPNLRISYWTLAIELAFYLGCIGLFAAGLLNRRLTAFAIVLAASLVGLALLPVTNNHTVWGLMEVVLNLTSMFFGKVIRDTVIAERLGWRHIAACAAVYVPFAIGVALKRFGVDYHDNFFHGFSIGAAYVSAAGLFMLFAAFGERMAWRAMSFVGLISFSVYLMGSYTMVLIFHFFGAGRSPVEWLLFVASVVAASILVSWLSYAVVEKPLISFGHRFRSQKRRAVAMAPAPSVQSAE